ncbi:sodium-dependent lysophosphatidylcholine symporter 1-A isoform X3 [Tachysurus vachellii]|uniref:sodium-dependent lysophosphatidylcholine symporter 1-A isoform X3 n=1 Tax=Tachysurus vachellii TaxID=175792 RepID=UPI00296B29DB|nr:sodium-dependent lysophosphatidylcholine symporter 1-A isoform X3 [Tachysurus vachellii]
MAPEEDVEFPVSLLPPDKHIGNDGLKFIQKKRTLGMSVCSKLCFAIGGAPYQITGSSLGFFLQIYLLDVAQLEPFYASIILFAGRVWDAVTDPTVGFLVSRSQWTRHGRMMPWIVMSTPFAVLSYFLIWVVPPVEKGKVLWYLFFYCMFQSLQTCFHVPYSALTMFISSEQKERDSATAYRMTVEVFGTVLGTAIQGQIVGGATAPCLNDTSFLNDSYNVMQLNFEVNVSHVTLEDTKQAYMLASGVISVIYIICAAVLFLGVREQQDVSIVKAECLSFVESLKLLQKHGPYVKLVTGFLFTSLAFMLMEGNFALFLTYTLGLRGDFQNILLVIMLSGTLSIPLWQLFLTRFGKKSAVYVGITWAIPFMILVVCIESTLIITYIVAVAAGASVAAAFLLPCFAGYMSRVCVQPDSVKLTLKLLVSAVPVSFIILGLLIFRSYPITEERRRHNRQRLHALLHDSSEDSENSRLPGSSI